MNPLFSLEKKTAIVTGGGSGIGESIATTFAGLGAHVIILDHDWPKAQEVAKRLDAEAYPLDVRDAGACAKIAEDLGAPDILVNNAGIGHVGDLLLTSAEDLDRLYSVNVRGVFNCCKAFVPPMIVNQRGSVINMGSIGGVTAVRDRLAYTITKHAVVGLTKALALDHSHSGVRFNAICPGRVETPFVMDRIAEYPDPQKARAMMESTQLTGRMARPEEIAAAAVYLASDSSAMVTGSCLLIDGGWNCGK
jgi:NAD(P)-dependent dehydrogenase (short-subunit alcohol dehydrogenase family)